MFIQFIQISLLRCETAHQPWRTCVHAWKLVQKPQLRKSASRLSLSHIAFTAASTGKGKWCVCTTSHFAAHYIYIAGSHAPAKAAHIHALAKGAGKGAKGAKGARKGFSNFSQHAWFTNCTLPPMSIDRIGKSFYLNRSKGHGKKGSRWGQQSHGYKKWWDRDLWVRSLKYLNMLRQVVHVFRARCHNSIAATWLEPHRRARHQTLRIYPYEETLTTLIGQRWA